jgi:hypothetical protein
MSYSQARMTNPNGQNTGALGDEDISFCRDTLARWVEEIFCDLFSICLIGPAYSLALIELTGATVLAGESGTAVPEFHLFVEDHPAEVARFASQMQLLRKLGWWSEIQHFNCAAIEVLRLSEEKSKDLHLQLSLPTAVSEKRFLQCYRELCRWIFHYIQKHVPTPRSEITDFHEQSGIICDYLREAVVPSTIIIKNQSVHPTPIVLINSAFRFYLEHLPELIANLDGEEKDSIETRSRFTERLELWTLKAIEDYRLLRRQET